jgi:hypothetical protein
MRFMMLVKASPESEAGEMPSTELFEEMDRYNNELIKAGVLLAADGLHPSSNGFKIRFEGKKRTVIDGPFTEAKELLAGYWIIQVKSREEAIEWAKRVPFEESDLEVRQIYDVSDWPDGVLPENIAAKEQAWQDAQKPIGAN